MTDEIFIYSNGDIQTHKLRGFYYRFKTQDKAFSVPEGVEEICPSAFMECCATAFILPDSLTKIRAMAFYYCKNLQAVFIPKGVDTIGNNAFEGCEKLEIYCEGEPRKGWIEEPPEYRTERVTTDDDYAFDFHRGGVSYTNIKVRVSKHWNPDNRPVYKNFSREEFVKKFNALNTLK